MADCEIEAENTVYNNTRYEKANQRWFAFLRNCAYMQTYLEIYRRIDYDIMSVSEESL